MSMEQAAPAAPATAQAGAEATQTAAAPSGAPAPPDIASAPLHEVRAYLRHRGESPPPTSATAQPGVAEAGTEAPPGAEAGRSPEAAAPDAEGEAATTPQARESRRQKAAPSSALDPAVLQRQNASLAGNIQQMQAQRQAEQAAFAQMQQELARLQATLVEQERRAFQSEVAALPPDVRERALAQYDGDRKAEQHQRDLSQYHGYLDQVKQGQDQREQHLAGLTRQLELADQRAALPAMFEAYAPFLAEKYGIDPAYMQQIVRSDSIKQAMALYNDEHHALLIGETLAAMAEIAGQQTAAQRQQNAQAATERGVHRVEAGVGTGGGMSQVDRIRNATPAQFREIREQMKREAARRPA